MTWKGSHRASAPRKAAAPLTAANAFCDVLLAVWRPVSQAHGVNAVQVYLKVLELRKRLQDADLAAKGLAAYVPPEELMELLGKLRQCHEVVEKFIARLPGISSKR